MLPSFAGRLTAPVVALALIGICYGLARFPSLPPGEGDKIAPGRSLPRFGAVVFRRLVNCIRKSVSQVLPSAFRAALWPLPSALRALPLVALTACWSCAAQEKADRPEWKLTFEDNFDGDHLDLHRWTPADPWGRERNQELQAYVTNSFIVKDGVLSITADKQSATHAGKTRTYTSGMMTTYGKFSQQYGRFEIRCRVPKGKGLWPAFWLLPEPLGWPPEIDVLEILGHQTDKVYMTHHFNDDQGRHQQEGGSWIGPDFAEQFHQFAVEWSPERIIWFVDDVERFRSEKPVPHRKMYMLINLALGGSWPGPPDEHTKLPARFDVDYVRVYERLK